MLDFSVIITFFFINFFVYFSDVKAEISNSPDPVAKYGTVGWSTSAARMVSSTQTHTDTHLSDFVSRADLPDCWPVPSCLGSP